MGALRVSEYQAGQVWCWARRNHCVLVRYVKYNWEQRHEIWDVLALEGDEAGRLVKGLMHGDTANGDGSRWERVA